MNPRPFLLAALLVAVGLLPAAAATPACTPSAAVRACADHVPYAGSLYCETPWSVGAGSDSVHVTHPQGDAWAYAGYWCFNYSNYGENPYQASDVFASTTLSGQRVLLWYHSSYYTYYTDAGGPYYGSGCRANYAVNAQAQWVECPDLPAPWGTLLTPLFQSYVSANADCKSGMAPTVQVCWRGNPSGQVAAASACTTTSQARARALGTSVDSPAAGTVGCLVFREVLGP